MKVPVCVFLVACMSLVGSLEVHVYEVPDPLFEVFSPRGLRVSVPDSRDVKSVEFFIVVPRLPEALTQKVNHTDGRYWIYWNPNVVLNLYDKIQYKLVILHRDLYWKKEGSHVVQKVLPISSHLNDKDCIQNHDKKIAPMPSSLFNAEEHQRGVITTGKTSNFKSSYSTIKNSELKPITKSTTSTTSGTFYVKPSGVMEATGYKKGSSFDSTKREGEQWEHYQSELTAEELENMRRLYEFGLDGFPQLNDKLFPKTAKVYEKKFMTSESKSFPGETSSVVYHSNPITAQFHQTHKTHESSTVSHSKPLFQFHYTDTAGAGSSLVGSEKNEEKLYRLEPLTKLPNPLPPQGTIFKTTEYVREEHTVPAGEVSQIHNDKEVFRTIPQKYVQSSQATELSTRNQEIIKPILPQLSIGEKTNQFEYNSGNLETVEKQNYRGRHYLGNIFTSVKINKVKAPQECSLVPGIDYTPTNNIREVEKYVYELSCLATLAESTMKEEIALLKQKNAEYGRKLELLEHEIKRLSAECKCYE